MASLEHARHTEGGMVHDELTSASVAPFHFLSGILVGTVTHQEEMDKAPLLKIQTPKKNLMKDKCKKKHLIHEGT